MSLFFVRWILIFLLLTIFVASSLWYGRGELDVDHNSYAIPQVHKRPTLQMKDYYKQKDRLLLEHWVVTRQTFPNQHFLGSVLKDGFHSDLPDDAMWEQSQIKRGPEVKSKKVLHMKQEPPKH